MHRKTTIEETVMRRVRRVHLMRRALAPFYLKVYGLIAAAAVGVSLVSVPNVIANATNVGLAGLYDYTLAALTDTELTVQLALLAVAALVLLLARDIIMQTREGHRAPALARL